MLQKGDNKMNEKTYDITQLGTPKEVMEFDDHDGDDDYGCPIIRTTYSCPTCGHKFWKREIGAYECEKCGQRLLW